VVPNTTDLTYDHVVPRAQGGKTTWENIVSCCIACNNRKSDRTPQQANMLLRKKPIKPNWTPQRRLVIMFPSTPAQWRDYLYWNSELENDNE
jgi:5-methylcytosine-specific restriction endonuclease McrA